MKWYLFFTSHLRCVDIYYVPPEMAASNEVCNVVAAKSPPFDGMAVINECTTLYVMMIKNKNKKRICDKK